MFYYALIFVLEITKAGQPVVLFVDRYETNFECQAALSTVKEKLPEEEKKRAGCKLMIDESKLKEV